MNKVPNRQVICEVLVEKAYEDHNIVVLCSDSRGSASLIPFTQIHPKQFIEVGIAEQNLVSIGAGLASCGKRSFAVSPACFLSTRSMEQIKVDVCYSHTNVKLIGISGGVSYGALGMTHHSIQDIATLSAIPNMRVYIPSDRFQTRKLIEELIQDEEPAYVRVGRNPVEDVYEEDRVPFEMNRAIQLKEGRDITLIACGEMVKVAQEVAIALKEEGIEARVLDMYCIKPIDEVAIQKAARETKGIITLEEHTLIGGMGARVSQIVAATMPIKVINLALPDEPVVAGNSKEIFDYYELNVVGVKKRAMELIKDVK